MGNVWTREHYDGDFTLCSAPSTRPAVTLVFVQSREGNTATSRPDTLGGGPTDKHLLYEGLSRVAADAVLAGAATVSGPATFFSVWHPEIVALRQARGLPRHPAQVVISNEGHIDLDRTLLFNVPEVPVYVLAGPGCRARCAAGFAQRPWITIVDLGPGGLAAALGQLRSTHGIGRISAVGGRVVASALIDAGLVQDLCLTTTVLSAGEPNTPYYVGDRRLSWTVIVEKALPTGAHPIRFEHLALPTARNAV
jgi:riboflavin biosynthesis pyrimidine reductase